MAHVSIVHNYMLGKLLNKIIGNIKACLEEPAAEKCLKPTHMMYSGSTIE
jgi:hypothetical protein